MVRPLFATWVLLGIVAATPAPAAPGDLDRAVALHDPEVLDALDLGGWGLGYMVLPDWQPPDPAKRMSNLVLSTRPEMQVIRTTLAQEFEDHIAALRAERCALTGIEDPPRPPDCGVGVGMTTDVRVFDKRFLTTSYAHFLLSGIVNRMDRAFKTPETCGEVRLLYRLNYLVPARPGREEISSRLPMTINLVFKAKDPADTTTTCADIARSWLWAGNLTTTGAALLADLKSQQGPLRYIKCELLDRAEINLQLDRWPTRVEVNKFEGGSAAYLLRIFKLTKQALPDGGYREVYLPAKLENQVDRERMLADAALKERLKAYLLDPANIAKLDKGTLIVDDEFLAYRALSMTPGNFSRRENRPYEGLLSDADIKATLAALQRQGTVPLYVPTVAGFKHRLNDLSCTGCHQTRAIGGFHFMGNDPKGTIKANTIVVPGSPHFFGDAPRRRDIITAFAEGRTPDFTKGFSSRPVRARSRELEGTGLLDGWGSHCHVDAGTTRADPSFASWKCAREDNAGNPLQLRCQSLFKNAKTPNFGVCMTAGAPVVGDPLDYGKVETLPSGRDVYTSFTADAINSYEDTRPAQRSIWRFHHSLGNDGFAGGLRRTTECPRGPGRQDPLPKEAACGAKPRDGNAYKYCVRTRGANSPDCEPYKVQPGGEAGFNTCILTRPFVECLRLTTQQVGLRACDITNPCRDDYICTERQDPKTNNGMPGACMPPYFLFQFRVDGHLQSLGPLLDE